MGPTKREKKKANMGKKVTRNKKTREEIKPRNVGAKKIRKGREEDE